jgi:hypothetical protein
VRAGKREARSHAAYNYREVCNFILERVQRLLGLGLGESQTAGGGGGRRPPAAAERGSTNQCQGHGQVE